jgi:hypothetical protein
MQHLRNAVAGVAAFDQLSHADKQRFFAWALHGAGKEHLKPADFAACYDAVHLQPPGNLHRDLKSLEKRDLLKSAQGYRLSKVQRDAHDAKYGGRPQTRQVHDLLAKLPAMLNSPGYREYLDEALLCFRVGSWRGAIIMAWNLAFDHLCSHVITKKLAEFNAVASAWKKSVTIAQRSDFQELRESQVISVCRDASITDKTQDKCLDRNLSIRNDAAHPSGAKFDQLRTEAFITEVVNTIVLGLK